MRDAGRNRRLTYVLVVVVFVLVVAFLVFNRHGFIALAALREEGDRVTCSIDSLQLQIDSLETEIARLRSDSVYIERMVREILGWGREGEQIIRFVTPDSTLSND